MRRLLLSILLVLLLVPGWSREPRIPLLREGPARVTARPVALDPRDPLADRVGALRYLGGVELVADDPAFGGFSALAVRPIAGGAEALLVGDGGGVVRLAIDARLRVRGARFGNLADGPGDGWEKRERDAEALAVDWAGGRAWVGFERANAIWRYDATLARGQAGGFPRAMRRWSRNSGAESLARDASGQFVAIAEARFAADGSGTEALWFAGDPVETPPAFAFRLRPPWGWRPVDAAFLPDGDLLILLRRASIADRGFASRLLRVARAEIRAGAVVTGEVLATLVRPLIHDNFEGLAVTRERGRTLLWLVSDANQGWPQRSLLLKFALDMPMSGLAGRCREPDRPDGRRKLC